MRHSTRPLVSLAAFAVSLSLCLAAAGPISDLFERDKFRPLDELLPTPNAYRTASGAPGHAYWQQKVDYDIDVTLDDEAKRITGAETVTYWNRSPDTLRYLWVQLDPNIFSPESHAERTRSATDPTRLSLGRLKDMLDREAFDGSCEIRRVASADGRPLRHTIVDTVMRVDLPTPLSPGDRIDFDIEWTYAINDHDEVGGRTGYEHFEDDGNRIYEIAQWFPRLCKYSDAGGWQNKTYLGSGEFTLEFGDYRVRLTVPDDHVVAATGVLQNPEEVLKPEWRERLARARTSTEPLFIVTPEEAKANEASKPGGTRTWEFRAEDVRDFAWASSRKFAWDAAVTESGGHGNGGAPVLCMSFYPKEAEPLWSRYSTQAIQHTIDVYSRHAFDYPYPVAISVNGPVGGMEYPMICFNGPRPEADGTYSERTKYGLISVVIHEVGHNYFPMVVNSDERQWTWMDERLNTFLQFLAEQAWSDDYPSRSGEPAGIVSYMASEGQVPIMTSADSVLNSGSNAYAKPATALNILRESVLGREQFDFAFREYAQRWMFKHPTPADFFRTMEDASGVDLDWFFRGWFYTTEKVDVAITGVRSFSIDTQDPDVEKPRRREERDKEPVTLTRSRNRDVETRVDRLPGLADFYDTYDELVVTEEDREQYRKAIAGMKEDERELLRRDLRIHVVDLKNEGGLVGPVVLEFQFEDGTVREERLPAEIWRRDADAFSKLVVSTSPLIRVVLDPHLESADVDRKDNVYPPAIDEERIELRAGGAGFGRRGGGGGGSNPMRDARKAEERRAKEAEKKAGEPKGGATNPDTAEPAGADAAKSPDPSGQAASASGSSGGAASGG